MTENVYDSVFDGKYRISFVLLPLENFAIDTAILLQSVLAIDTVKSILDDFDVALKL